MSYFLTVLALLAQATSEPQPFALGETATSDGAKLTVTRLLEATRAQDDAAFNKIARGMVIMLAPDFGAPVDRAKFAETLKNCAGTQIVNSEPFPKLPQAQVVRISMQCRDKKHTKMQEALADIMADNEHAFAVFPGGVAKIWPKAEQ